MAEKKDQCCWAEIDIWLGHLKSLLIPSQTPPCPISGHSAARPPRVGTFLLHRNLFPQLTLNQQLPQSDLMCSPSASSTEVISCSVQLHLLPMPAGTSLPPPTFLKYSKFSSKPIKPIFCLSRAKLVYFPSLRLPRATNKQI